MPQVYPIKITDRGHAAMMSRTKIVLTTDEFHAVYAALTFTKLVIIRS